VLINKDGGVYTYQFFVTSRIVY